MGINLRRRMIPGRPEPGRLPLTSAGVRVRPKNNRSSNQGWLLFVLGLLLVGVLIALVSTRSGSAISPLSGSFAQVELQPPKDGTYSVIVVGSGPAGLSAALFAARASLSVLVFGSTVGGLLSQATDLDNFPSYVGGNSLQWLQQSQQQAARAGAAFAQPSDSVQSLKLLDDKGVFQLQTSANQTFHAQSVIVATGATPRRLHLGQVEDLLWGKMIHSCAVCDAGAYGPSDTVLVVGGGDAAVAATLYLARSVKKVILVHRKAELSRPKNQQAVAQLKQTKNVELKMPYVVKEWRTRKSMTGMLDLIGATLVHANDPSQTETVDIPGAFMMIGSTPNTEWLKSSPVVLDEHGFVNLDKTKTQGVFAAGEVAEGVYRQAITAAAEGAQAAMDAERWLASLPQDGSRPVLPAAVAPEAQAKPVQKKERRDQQVGDLYNDCDDLVEKDCIMSLVNAFPVVVFSKPWCPYCQKALEALTAEGVRSSDKIHVVDLTRYETSRNIQDTLKSFTGRHSVPNVFVGGRSIGGGDETVTLHRQGKLKEILLKAGAIM